MSIELPIDDLIKLARMASLGKLIAGLIHNINGPLQNLGLDIEMTNHTLMKSTHSNDELVSTIQNRLRRMCDEFERLEEIIRAASVKTDPDQEYPEFLSLKDVLHQEMFFLEANLYFKHNVEKKLTFEDTLPSIVSFPKNFPQALSWFLQTIIDELEAKEIKLLRINAVKNNSTIILDISTVEKNIFDHFLKIYNEQISSTNQLKIENNNIMLSLVFVIFQACNVSVTSQDNQAGSHVTLTIPFTK